jgi:hypothetical protein
MAVRRRFALLVVSTLVAVSSALFTATPALADHCSVWADYANGRGRAHASCPGYEVAVRVYCADGSRIWSNPRWRAGYNKAECPSGIGVITFEYYTR